MYIFLKNIAFAFDLNAWELVKGGGRGDLGGIIGFGLLSDGSKSREGLQVQLRKRLGGSLISRHIDNGDSDVVFRLSVFRLMVEIERVEVKGFKSRTTQKSILKTTRNT